MTMTTYYKYVRNRLESDIVLRNQCNGSWQLTFNVDEWQNSDINSAMYQNLEKLLNTVQNADECQYMPDATLNASYPACR